MEMICKLGTRIKELDQDPQRKVAKLNWSSPSILKSRTTISFHLMLEKWKRKSKIVVIPKSRTKSLFQAKLDLTKRKLKVKVIPKSKTEMFQQKLNQTMRKMKVTVSPKSKIFNISYHSGTLIIIPIDYISSVFNLCQLFNSH